jgi:hypothetical protein
VFVLICLSSSSSSATSYEARKKLFYNGQDFDRFSRELQNEEQLAAQQAAIKQQQHAIQQQQVSDGAACSVRPKQSRL